MTSWLLSANCQVAVRSQMYCRKSRVFNELIFVAFYWFRILLHVHLLGEREGEGDVGQYLLAVGFYDCPLHLFSVNLIILLYMQHNKKKKQLTRDILGV